MVLLHHYIIMRLSITLDDDLHRIASTRARARRTSISKEINALLRQATMPSPPQFVVPVHASVDPAKHTPDSATGLLISHGRLRFPVSPGRPGLTLAMLQQAENDEDFRHMAPGLPPGGQTP